MVSLSYFLRYSLSLLSVLAFCEEAPTEDENISAASSSVKPKPSPKPQVAVEKPTDIKPPTQATPPVALQAQEYEYKTNPEKTFKMNIPSSWIPKEDYMGYEVFFEPKEKLIPTLENPLVADPNMSVKVLNQPIPIDPQSLEEYGASIQKKFSESNGIGSAFEIFQKSIQEVEPGKKFLLYDARYSQGENEVFQTIVVMSSQTQLFRVTLTDEKTSFQKNRELLFPFMTSLVLSTPSLERSSPLLVYLPWIAVLGGLLTLLFVISFLRRRNNGSMQHHNDNKSLPPFSMSGESGSQSGFNQRFSDVGSESFSTDKSSTDKSKKENPPSFPGNEDSKF